MRARTAACTWPQETDTWVSTNIHHALNQEQALHHQVVVDLSRYISDETPLTTIPAIVQYLLEQFSSPSKDEKQAFLDSQNEYGNTGLHWAAMNGHLTVVKVLMEAGASPALANDKNYVPLDLAGLNDHVEVVDYFLAQSSKLEAKNDEGLAAAADAVEVEGGDDADGQEESAASSSKNPK
jgi:ankyrin repeat protein